LRYTIIDQAGITSTATVTIHVPPHTQDDIVQLRLRITDLDGNEITELDNQGRPIIDQGTEFRVETYVRDLRGQPGRPPLDNPDFPVDSPAEGGVFSAHMDLLFDAGLTPYAGDNRLVWGDAYPQGRKVDSSIPGLLNEIGAFASLTPLGVTERLLYAATFRATSLGVATFRTDPADLVQNETLVYGRSSPPAARVPYDRIDFGQTSIQVVPTRKLVEIQLVATDLTGNPLPNNVVQAGQQFLVSAFVQDIREDFPDSLKGVFSAYLDVLYPANLATPVPSATSGFGFTIDFAAPFTEGRKAQFLPASGLIDEVGAFRASAPAQPSTPQQQRLFTTRFTAQFPPGGIGSIVFTADPADLQPQNQVSLIRSGVLDPITGVDFGLAVPTAQVSYVSTPVITVIGAAGEAEFTNPSNPLDVNNDGYVTPMDALFVMNFLNTHGPVDLKNLFSGGAEGEAGVIHYYDTNGDGIISPADVLPIINHLNAAARLVTQGGQAEGEADWGTGASENIALVVDPTAVAAMIDLVDASEARIRLAEAEAKALATAEPLDLLEDAYRMSALDDVEDSDDLNWWLEDELVEDIAEAWKSPDAMDILGELVA
jgi:hypothetical protein